MPLDRRIFSILDTDTAPEAVPNGRAWALRNLAPERGYLRTLWGNQRLPVLLPPGNNQTVVTAELPGTSGGLAWLNWNDAGLHTVVRQLPGQAPVVLLTWAGLNLPAPSATSYVPVAVLDSFLLYLDADGELRNLPLSRLAAGEFTAARLAAEPWGLHAVKVPPRFPLAVRRDTITGTDPLLIARLVAQRAWQFTYRYQYEDGEVTILAPFSSWLDILKDQATTVDNAIRVELPTTLPAGLREFDLLVRQPGDEGWRIVESLRRDSAGAFPAVYFFYGLTKGDVVQGNDADRLYEALWPARAFTLARNRAWVGNLRGVGYVTPEPAFATTILYAPASASSPDPATFHENCSYRIVAQFYDELGRPGGCSQPRTVTIPPQDKNNLSLRSVRVALTTTGAAALNAEIPVWAKYMRWLVAPNDRTPHFTQGRAGDVFAYLGLEQKPDDSGAQQEYVKLANILTTPHQQVAIDLGPFVATGQGYVWQAGSGDVVRYLDEDKEFLIAGQRGDYIFHNWTGQPGQGLDGNGNHTKVRIEIYSPKTTQGAVYYERGPTVPIVRTLVGGTEQRSYGQATVTLSGDAFLVPMSFPVVNRGSGGNVADVYDPPLRKVYKDDPTPLLFESMVPPFRLVPTRTTVTTATNIPLFGFLASQNADFAAQLGVGTSTKADTAARSSASLLWLDMSYGGRPGVVLPLALQRVELPTAVAYSGARLGGSLLNGLSTWQALDQRELAREQGSVQALAPANDVQSEDQVLVAVCREGVVSIGVDVARVRQADGGTITTDSSQVIGSISSRLNQLGTRHPRTVTSRGGQLHWWCADQAEVCRYAQDGVNGLNSQKEARALGAELAAGYGAAVLHAGFDVRTREYVLCCGADPVSGAPARTVRYGERAQGFVGDADFTPEALVGTINRRLVSFVNGQAWEHTESATRMNFYGVQYAAELKTWANEQGDFDKTWKALRIKSGPELWELTRAETPDGQYTLIPASHMERLESIWHGALLMDATSPGFAGLSVTQALYEGVPVQGLALLLTLRCTSSAPGVRLLGVEVEYIINGGQTAPQ